jgi:hypothetical protein
LQQEKKHTKLKHFSTRSWRDKNITLKKHTLILNVNSK